MTSESSSKSTAGVTRRAMLQTATAAATAVAFTLKPATADAACAAQSPVSYGTGSGQHPLTDQNIAPLFSAWLILTTNAPDLPTSALIQAVANVDKPTGDAILSVYNSCPDAFAAVRELFGCLAYSFAAPVSPYSGGQCPEKIDTINPVSTVSTSHPATSCHVTNPSTNNLNCPSCFPDAFKDKIKENLTKKQSSKSKN